MGSRLFWVVQRSAWGYEQFDVVEIRGDEIMTIYKTAGGICVTSPRRDGVWPGARNRLDAGRPLSGRRSSLPHRPWRKVLVP